MTTEHLGIDDAPEDVGWQGERTPPHDLLAEQSALGGMMLSRDVVQDVIDELVPTDFYLPKHEVIALATVALYRRGEPTDVIAVTDELTKTGMLTKAGGAEYLHTLTGIVPTAANAGFYARVVAEKAIMRRLVEAGTRIVQMGYASEGAVDALASNARAEVEAVVTRRKLAVHAVGETFDKVINALDSTPTYSPTPWRSLDKLIGGFAPGALYVFAARPGSGKTIAVMQAATRLATVGSVAFSSLEMAEQELQLRLIAQYGPVHMTALRNHQLTDIDWNLVADARRRLIDAPIFIDTTRKATVAHIATHARAVARRQPLAGVVVDYLQLVRGEGADERQQLDQVTEDLRALAAELNVPLIAAVQLRRPENARGRRALPTLGELRGSGGIEQTADVVVLMDRDEEKKPNEIQLVVAKNRHGSQGKFTLSWQAHYSRLHDPEWRPTALIEEEAL